jgi:ubiquinone/menaquinone biosynthesis C-methylase UbiE
MDYRDTVLENPTDAYKKRFQDEKVYLAHVLHTDDTVLEVGCGDGRSMFDILSITQNMIGIDHNDDVIDRARKNFSPYPSVKIVKAEATELPFEDWLFDCVMCMGSFTNFADKKFAALEEMKRVLKPHGKIVISTFSEDALEERMKVYTRIDIKIKEIHDGNVIFDDVLDDNISEQFTKKQLEDIFQQWSLKIENIKKVDIAYLCTLTK